MGVLFRQDERAEKENDNNILLLEAKEGNKDARNKLIKMYTPFILKTAAKVSGRYIRVGEDEEVSIGMMAFNEAINSFDYNKNIPFITFAETVIKRRLIDYFRKENKQKNYIPFSNFDNDTDENQELSTIKYIEAQKSMEQFKRDSESAERKEEIIRFSQVLNEFNISFSELVKICPKHEDARLRAMEVARIVSGDPELVKVLLNKKELPLKRIESIVNISRKTLERQRKYIIAIVLIIVKDFEHLKGYIKNIT